MGIEWVVVKQEEVQAETAHKNKQYQTQGSVIRTDFGNDAADPSN